MWELDHKEGCVPKNWCLWTMVLEKTLESHLDCKEIKPVHPKGNQSWIFIERTDAEVEALIVWPPDWKNWLLGKDPDAGKDWSQEEKGTTEDEMVGWHHQLNEHEFKQTPGDGEGLGGLACCSPWGSKESAMTEPLNNNNGYAWELSEFPKVKWNLFSCVWLFVTPWTIQSVEFSRPEYWSGQPFPSPRDLPNPGIKPRSPTLQADSYQLSHKGSPRILEWVGYPFSSGSSQSRNWTWVSCTAGRFLYQSSYQGSPSFQICSQ